MGTEQNGEVKEMHNTMTNGMRMRISMDQLEHEKDVLLNPPRDCMARTAMIVAETTGNLDRLVAQLKPLYAHVIVQRDLWVATELIKAGRVSDLFYKATVRSGDNSVFALVTQWRFVSNGLRRVVIINDCDEHVSCRSWAVDAVFNGEDFNGADPVGICRALEL